MRLWSVAYGYLLDNSMGGHCLCHFWRLNWNNFRTLHIVRLVEFVRLRQRLHVQFRLFFVLCFRFFDVIVLPRVNIGWQCAGELSNASSTCDNCLSVLNHSLSHVASLDTRWEWSIVVPTFDKRSLMREITIVSNFYMWQRSWGINLWHSYGWASGIILRISCTRPTSWRVQVNHLR